MKIVTASLFLFIFGCASSSFYDGCKNITPLKMEAWLDLMPGGEGSFLFAGYMELKVEDTCGVQKSFDGTFQLIQSDEKLHTADAKILLEDISLEETDGLYKIKYLITPHEKMSVNTVSSERNLDIILNIKCGDELIQTKFNSIPIMKVY